MNEFSGAPYSDQTNWTYSHYPNQIGQSGDAVILLVAERFSIAAQHRYICAGPIGALGVSAPPPRLIQATSKPKCLAPATSKLFDETNSTSSFFSLSVFSTSA